ncbi:hypothetical protein K3495_g12929 [Podosphaera aphanis]|nr:hypothetical protein K3495_g12929 [Podosphaera aphanis]
MSTYAAATNPTTIPISNISKRLDAIQSHLKSASEFNMSVPYKFAGWMGLDKDAVKGKMVWQEFEPKPWTESDIDVKITHCGICGSDMATLGSGWGPSMYPCCVGHEIVGTIVKIGKNVKHVQLGDRVGVGAQSSSCENCEFCAKDEEQYCVHGMIGTYNSKYSDGSKSYGGYADYCRLPARFAVKIPEGISSAEAAPMLCAGVTVYKPLKYNGAGPGKKVGIAGMGGLGHFGILWSKALECDEVVAISRGIGKKEDALKLGATKFISTTEEGWEQKNAGTLDLIIFTSPCFPKVNYFSLLRPHGEIIQVGVPEDNPAPFNTLPLIQKGAKYGGSLIGSPSDIIEMLNLAVEKNVHPMIEERPLKEANQAVLDMKDGKPRYRYVLKNEKHADEEKV